MHLSVRVGGNRHVWFWLERCGVGRNKAEKMADRNVIPLRKLGQNLQVHTCLSQTFGDNEILLQIEDSSIWKTSALER